MVEACPKCGFAGTAGTPDCPRCGVVFRRLEERARRPATPVETVSPADGDPPADRALGRRELTLLAGGLGSALLVHAVPFPRYVMSAFVTLFHELGHAVASWLLGHPAVPAFDLVYGGGFTHQDNFQLPLAVAIGAGWVALGWVFRRNLRTLAVLAPCFGLWLLLVSADWRRELAVAAMGHLGELALTGAFFYMVLANVGWRAPAVERPVGAFIAFFVQIHCMRFAWKLGHDADFLAWYMRGKGGALMNDLESISLNLQIFTGIRPDVTTLADWLLLVSPLPFGVAFALYRFRSRVRRFAASLLATEPA